MSLSKAFQIAVTSKNQSETQVFFVEAETGEAAVTALSRHPAILRDAELKVQRRLSDSELDMHQIGPNMIVQWK